MNVPVAHGSYGKVVLGSDSSTGRTVVIKIQRANSDEAVREHRVFKAIRGARASGRASDGVQYVLGLMDDVTNHYDAT